MGQFTYYFPGLRNPVTNVKQLPPDTGLGKVLDGADWSYAFLPKGPDGGSGAAISMAKKAIEHKPDSQTWTVCKHDGKVTHYIGWDHDDRPTPKDLKRPDTVDGHFVKLGDGNEWLIPCVRFDGGSLTREFRLVDGELKMIVESKFSDILEESDKWFELLVMANAGLKPSFKVAEIFSFVVSLLAINYRVGVPECACGLGTIESSHSLFLSVIDAAFGFADLSKEDEFQKKQDATV